MSEKKIEKVVYIVRHGQSADNVAPVFQSTDSPLNEKGHKQAESMANRISKLSFEALIASPYRRTRETAETISKATGKPIEFSNLFVESIKPTGISGKPYTNNEASTTWREWKKSLYTPGLRVEKGENFDDIITRTDMALAFLYARPEKSLVVVTHGYLLRTIVARVLLGNTLSATAFKNFQLSADTKNTGITVIRYHGGFEEEPHWHLWVYNDHAHLG